MLKNGPENRPVEELVSDLHRRLRLPPEGGKLTGTGVRRRSRVYAILSYRINRSFVESAGGEVYPEGSPEAQEVITHLEQIAGCALAERYT